MRLTITDVRQYPTIHRLTHDHRRELAAHTNVYCFSGTHAYSNACAHGHHRAAYPYGHTDHSRPG
ncbi:MAG: hypothetical protein H6663_10715 [Candidatus Promineofilum sp.]|nr:hypothetical protein [Promineifilum sp.]